MSNYKILLFYKYVEVGNPELIADEHLKWSLKNDIKGRVSLAKEGLN